MQTTQIAIRATVLANSKKVWEFYTLPEHITKWNFASEDWMCPSATNELWVGGKYRARMEAKDGSFGFDFEAIYEEVVDGKSFTYKMPDGRMSKVNLKEVDGFTEVVVIFDAENENSIELQREGWQSILNNFKNYVESN